MKTRPILFSAPMVRALMEGRKTQTRRIIKPQPSVEFKMVYLPGFNMGFNADFLAGKLGIEGLESPKIKTPYGQPGDLLWVRETWAMASRATDLAKIYYKAHENRSHTEFHELVSVDELPHKYQPTWPRFKPSIHMPRAFSRLTLEIIGVRVEKLRAISEADAIAEGFSSEDDFHDYWFEINPVSDFCVQGDAEDDPWVWVVEFKVHLINIDALLKQRGAA